MIKELNVEIPEEAGKRGRPASLTGVVADVKGFLESDSKTAEISVPEGQKSQSVRATYSTTIRRLGFSDSIRTIHYKNRVFLVKVR